MITDRNLLAIAIAANLATDEERQLYFHPPEPDPLADLTPEERIDHVIRSCSSGVWAECPPPTVVVPPDGRRVRVPPGYKPARGPRGRSPRGKRQGPDETTLCAPETDATGPDVPT